MGKVLDITLARSSKVVEEVRRQSGGPFGRFSRFSHFSLTLHIFSIPCTWGNPSARCPRGAMAATGSIGSFQETQYSSLYRE